jgi:hypothetical protein
MLSLVSLNFSTEVRDMTFRSPSLDSSVSRSSCTPSTKKNVRFQCTAIGKRQHCDGLAGCCANTPATLVLTPIVIEREVNQGGCHHADDKEIELTPGSICHGPFAINFIIALDTFRRQFKCPGQDQRDRQAGSQHQEYQLAHPRLKFEYRDDHVDDLQHQPTDHRIGQPYAKNITAFQFIE